MTLRLESGEDLPFVVDTGTPITLFDDSLKPILGKCQLTMPFHALGGEQESGVYLAPKLHLGGTPLKTDSYVATFSFKRLSSLCGHSIKGILGMDCLRHYCLQLDFEAGRMRFLDPDHVNASDLGKVFALTFSSKGQNFPPIFSDASQNQSLPSIHHIGLFGGISTNSLIDTGENIDGDIENGVIKGHYPTRFIHYLISSRAMRLPECVWDGETYLKLSVAQGQDASRLGLRFLARHLVTLNFPERIMYLKQTSVGPLGDQNSEKTLKRLHD